MEERSYMFTKEERNFLILDVLIKYVAQPAVKKRFDAIIPPADLSTVLSSNVRVIQNLISKKVINVYQQKVLQRVSGFNIPTTMMVPTPKTTATSSADFDITLMICLLRNLKLVQEPITGWDRLPPDSDNSLGANLTRIKVYRNILSHPSKSRVNETSFNKIWSSLKQALSEISEGRTDSIVDKTKLLDIAFDGSNKEELLCRIQQEVLEMKRELQYHQNTINLIEKWRTDARDFYNTRGTEKVLEKIRSHSTTMIVGHSGSGKSATMRYVSLLLEEEGFEIIPVSYASDILFQRFSTRKQLFIIDDII
ncbi:E3 ubiquitin-protein ligase DZIP3-like, partial [Saccostrea cucullata]|uniref:E3 ubiquitin-protein ligase DZIP3-like n=1 Tax=Saccostrea cuccullata TaxID=36930 RepID=UPI002ED1D1F0